MRLGSEKPQSQKFTMVLSPDAATDSIQIPDAKPVEPVRFNTCMMHPWLIIV